MDNAGVAKILRQVADLLDGMGENRFKVRAYQVAAQTVETLDEDIRSVLKENRLREIPGIGEALSEKITEILDTGRLRHLEDLRKKAPADFDKMVTVESLGPKKVFALYRKLGIETLKDLEDAAFSGKIRKIEGFGEKSERNILAALASVPSTDMRTPYAEAKKAADRIIAYLKKGSGIKKIEAAGSLRRKKATIGDIDLLAVSSNPKKTVAAFIGMPGVTKVLGKGGKKASVKTKSGMQVDLRVVPKGSWGSALLHFTGSKAHNIALRKIAQKKGWKLNEYGLFDELGVVLASKTERGVYAALGLLFLPPEQREEKLNPEKK